MIMSSYDDDDDDDKHLGERPPRDRRLALRDPLVQLLHAGVPESDAGEAVDRLALDVQRRHTYIKGAHPPIQSTPHKVDAP
eukprot:1190026-Prorocentrum_minimum.AAC.2